MIATLLFIALCVAIICIFASILVPVVLVISALWCLLWILHIIF